MLATGAAPTVWRHRVRILPCTSPVIIAQDSVIWITESNRNERFKLPDAPFSKSVLAIALALTGPAALPVSAQEAQEAGRIVLELNNATDTETGACRMTYVAKNNSDTGFERTGWQVGVFDTGGIVRSILSLEFGALAAGKTKIVLFDLPGRGCADISRVIVNDVTLCQPEGAAAETMAPICLDALTTRSRATIEFGV